MLTELNKANKMIDDFVLKVAPHLLKKDGDFPFPDQMGKVLEESATFLQPEVLLAMGQRGIILSHIAMYLSLKATHIAFGVGINKPCIKRADFVKLEQSLDAAFHILMDIILTYYRDYLKEEGRYV